MSTKLRTPVWEAYRSAFDEFSRRGRVVQILTAAKPASSPAIDDALLSLELAWVAYSRQRDALVKDLLEHDGEPALPTVPEGTQDRVRSIASLLWEMAGRPSGTEVQDWHRAEQIVRRAYY